MYLVFLKIPNKGATFAPDGVVAGCNYAVLERYVNPAQDLELYLDIQRGSANGFETSADAVAWAKPALEKIFRFVYSTPKVRKAYTKAYAKAVPADAETAEHAERAKSGMAVPYRTVGDRYPKGSPAEDNSLARLYGPFVPFNGVGSEEELSLRLYALGF